MTNGWRCSKASPGYWFAAALLLGLAGATFLWWVGQPRTPEDLFRTRCSSCHELRDRRLCEFLPELRPDIVGVMRSQHGADAVISAEEARVISRFLKEDLECP